MCNIHSLEDLSLEVCQLSGKIPSEIGNLTNLNNLILAVNQLSGNIPVEIENLSNLSVMDLRFNELSGSVPNEIENLPNINGIFLSYNELSGELDLSSLSNLRGLLLENNNFTSLNVQNGNNTNFTMFNITNNPNLICVFVDDASWSETNWLDKDETAQYFETQAECDTYLVVDDKQINTDILLFPNPTSNMVHIDIKQNRKIKKIEVFTVLGKLVKTTHTTNKINISSLSKGIYYFKILDNNYNQFIYKVIKK